MTGLDEAVIQLNDWFVAKFEKGYGRKDSEEIKHKVRETISPELDEWSSQNIVASFSSDNVIASVQGYFPGIYDIGNYMLAEYSDSLDDLEQRDRSVIEDFFDAIRKTNNLVYALQEYDNLDAEVIETEFRSIYPSLENFTDAYLQNVRIVFHGARKAFESGQGNHQFFDDLGHVLDEMDDKGLLLIDEVTKAYENHIIKVFDKAIGEIYK